MIKTISLVLPFSKAKELQMWFQIRKSDDSLKGLLEFPGGKVESHETPKEGARREFLEEVGIDICDQTLSLLKIHEHSQIDDMLFYIYGLQVACEDLPLKGWHKISLENLETFREKIPAENMIFLKDILKTL